jgi:hypothetical protein
MGVRSLARKPIELWERYERRLMLFGLLTGFIFDLIIADRPDSVTNNLLLVSYLSIAGGLILILNLRTARRAIDDLSSAPPLFLLLVLQFCFGGLASNLLVLYGRSGTLAASTLFFLILGGMLIGNEFLKTRYQQLRFNIVVYYILLFTYLIIAVPTFIFHSIGTTVFLASGVISLGIIGVFLWLVYRLVLRGRQREHQIYEVSFLIGVVFVFFNGLYFLGIIPPVPLVLRDVGIYHSLVKQGTVYVAKYEEGPVWKFWRSTSTTFTQTPLSRVYCFSAIFAPTDLQAPIHHRWERYDTMLGKWVTSSDVELPIAGGRDEGYRTYSTRAGLEEGRWRCSVETKDSALIGRFTFKVINSTEAPALSQKTL